ncbi:hypothetical protein K6Q96_16965 [Grimontia kaedaensis]|uniref:Lipoprotein n=1 Tax=Grimontia kaedaensis TaxID=2872157 RepID=A0ABY4X0Z8_9GAMM|nr:hypothetical protein [Grimontia kaedaensis]USH04935.1 hypothetical protein K6Q96_16965 [Grimontia kaedaensis]
MSKNRSNTFIIFTACIISGCQLTSEDVISRVYDPTIIEHYQLPVLLSEVDTVQSFRQRKAKETWYWTLLKNDSYLEGENLVVQIISQSPLKQPPSRFDFTLPGDGGVMEYNALGPYQSWFYETADGTRCTQSRHNIRNRETWLSVFTHFCTSNNEQEITWVKALTPSILLEGY